MSRGGIFAWVGFAGALASLVVAADTYLFDSRILEALRLPVQVPLGVLAAVSGTLFFIVVVAARTGRSNMKRKQQDQSAEDALSRADAEIQRLSQQVEELNSRLAAQSRVGLKRRIVALLEVESLSLKRIMEGLDVPSSPESRERVLDALGELIEDGKVMASAGKYTPRYL